MSATNQSIRMYQGTVSESGERSAKFCKSVKQYGSAEHSF